MEITFESNYWFDVEKDEQHVTISTATVDGDVVSIRIRNRSPYSKHLADLIEKLSGA